MTSSGTHYLGTLLSGDYQLLWVSTPADWYVRTPGKRAGPHWNRIRNLLVKARALRMQIVMFGPPGYMWKVTPIRDAIEDTKLHTVRMRLCSFGLQYDKHGTKPSGTYLQVATTFPLGAGIWRCMCKSHTEHQLDWYGKTQHHAEWRAQTLRTLTTRLLDQILKPTAPRNGRSFLSMWSRTDRNVGHYLTTLKKGPKVGRRT